MASMPLSALHLAFDLDLDLDLNMGCSVNAPPLACPLSCPAPRSLPAPQSASARRVRRLHGRTIFSFVGRGGAQRDAAQRPRANATQTQRNATHTSATATATHTEAHPIPALRQGTPRAATVTPPPSPRPLPPSCCAVCRGPKVRAGKSGGQAEGRGSHATPRVQARVQAPRSRRAGLSSDGQTRTKERVACGWGKATSRGGAAATWLRHRLRELLRPFGSVLSAPGPPAFSHRLCALAGSRSPLRARRTSHAHTASLAQRGRAGGRPVQL